MKAQELSRKYAVAVFSQALEKWLTALRLVNDRLVADAALAKTVQDSARSFADKQKALDAVVPDGVDQHVKNFLYLLLKEGDMGLLGQIIAELEFLTKGGPQIEVARVVTALALSDAEQDEFRQKLRKKHGENLEFEFVVDLSIIGGAVVQIGDKIIDGSVATRMESMKNLLGVK